MAGYLSGSLAGLLNVFLMLSSFERQILQAICLFKHQPSSVSFRLLRAIKKKKACVSGKTKLPLTFV